MRLETILASHAMRMPGKTALVAGARRVTYAEVYDGARAIAGGLKSAGVVTGDRVLIHLPNDVEFVEALFAVFMLGAIAVPINLRMTAKELVFFAQDSQPTAMLLHADSLAALQEVGDDLPACKWFVVDGAAADKSSYARLRESAGEKLPEVPVSAEACMILYTSGTTGRPKGAVMTSANLIIQHYFLNAIDWDISCDDVFLVTTPMAHRTGLARVLNALTLGATLVAMKRFNADNALELIATEKVTAIGMVPTVARMLLPALRLRPEICASLRHIIVTGEAFPTELKKTLIELLPQVQLHSFFAMTEVGSVTSLNHDEQFTHAASVGRPTAGVEVKLIDGDGKTVPTGQEGEMLVRTGIAGSFTTMRGYYNLPEETAATIIDGWVRTGDMAKVDEYGYVYIVDRKKDMIISGGFNIYTKEVEQALMEHPAIADVAVVGVPDPVFGESVVAYIEVQAGSEIDSDEVVEHCRSRIASYKKPKYVYFTDELPRTSLGKVLKSRLRETALQNLPTEGTV